MRKEIDKIDEQIVRLLKIRQELVKEIIKEKKINEIPIKDEEREKEIISKLRKIFDDKLVDMVYEVIFSSSY